MKSLLYSLFLMISLSNFAQLQVSSTTPASGANLHAVDGNISIQFSEVLNETSIAGKVVVRSKTLGILLAVTSTGGSSSITVNPNEDFLHGDMITISVLEGIEAAGGAVLGAGHVFQFKTSIAAAFSTPITLTARQSITFGSKKDIGVADVDLDNDLDIIDFGSSLQQLFNNGSQTFQYLGSSSIIDSPGGNASRMTLDDLENDGDIDIIFSHLTDDNVTWYENDGTGAYLEHELVANYDAPAQVISGDLNGDGFSDIVTTSESDLPKLFINNQDRTFTSSDITAFTSDPKYIEMADFDNDGDLDLVARHTSFSSVAWYENDGAGQFTRHAIDSGTGTITALSVGDLNDDGLMDFLLIGRLNDRIFWYQNNGDGSFDRNELITDVESPQRAEIGDIDGDGDQDVVYTSTENTTLLENDGNENFTAMVLLQGAGQALILADMNKDGRQDVVTYSSNTIYWLENKVNESPVLDNSLANANASAFLPFTYTFASDAFSDPDLTVLTYSAKLSDGNDLPAWLSFDPASRTFSGVASDSDAGVMTVSITATDPVGLSASDEIDVLITVPDLMDISSISPTNKQRNAVVSADIVINFSKAIDPTTLNASNIIVNSKRSGTVGGAFSGDNTTTITFDPTNDFVEADEITITISTDLSSTDGSIVAGNQLYSFSTESGMANSAPALFVQEAAMASSVNARHVITTDLNGDGYMDIISGAYNASSLVWSENDGAGNFTDHTISTSPTTNNKFDVGDFDQDGDLDIVTCALTGGNLLWLENDGSESFTKRTISTSVNFPLYVITRDLDLDGFVDIVLSENGLDKVMWYKNSGSGTFSEIEIGTLSTSPDVIGAEDVDSDGDIDVVVGGHNYGTNELIWLENDGLQNFSSNFITNTLDGLSDLDLKDVDDDGDIDILIAAQREDKVSILTNDGAQQFTRVDVGVAVESPIKSRWVDVDGDADLDIIVGSDGPNAVGWIEQTGSGYVYYKFAENEGNGLDYADFDGDGDIDIVSASDASDMIIWYKNKANETPIVANAKTNEVKIAEVSFSIDLSGIFSDPDGSNTLIYSATLGSDEALPDWMSFDAETERITGTASTAFVGTYQIKITATDHAGQSIPDEFELAIEQPPTIDVIATVPSHLAFVNVSAQISIQLDKTTNAATTAGSIVVRDQQGVSLSGSVTGGGTDMLTFVPTDDLVENETYRVSILNTIEAQDGSIMPLSSAYQFKTNSSMAPGQFLRREAIADYPFPSSIDIGDVDGNGFDDLLIGSFSSDLGSSILLSTETIFADAQSVVDGIPITSQSTFYDLDGDQNLDVISINSGVLYLGTNDGSGSFTYTSLTSTVSNPRHFEIADMDADGDADMVLISLNSVDIYIHDGSLGFSKLQISTTNYSSLSLVDLDMDMDLDVLVSGETSVWLENDGAMNFTTNAFIDFTGIEVVDIDQDNDLDALVSHENTISKYTNDGSMNFTQDVLYSSAENGSGGDVSAADIDGDGRLDFVASLSASGVLYYYHQLSDGTFESQLLSDIEFDIRDILIEDIDRDGTLDILACNYGKNEIAWYKNQTNVVPVLAIPADDQEVYDSELFSLQLPTGMFTDEDGDDLNYSVKRADDSTLPLWLRFDDETLILSGTPTAADVQVLMLKVEVNDGAGGIASNEFSLEIIAKLDQQISFSSLDSKTFGDTDFDLVASGGSSGNDVVFGSSDLNIASISNSTVTMHQSGEVVITATQAGNIQYNAAADVERTLLVNKAGQTIVFSELASKVVGDASFDLTATGGTSENEVTYTSSDETVATISGSSVTVLGAGIASITASQEGNENYTAATDVTQNLVVNKLSQVITFEAIDVKTFGDASLDLTASGGPSGNEVIYASSDESVAAISGSTITFVGVGATTITASQAGDDTYNPAADVTQELVVNKASQSITFNSIDSKVFGDTPFELTGTGGSSGNEVIYTSSDESVASISGSTITLVGVGATTITASQAGDDMYNPAADVTQELVVNKASQVITFNALDSKVFGDADFDLTATGGDSANEITYASSDESVATISGSTITLVGVGATAITASQTGDDNYNTAADVLQELVVNKASQVITFNSLESKVFGDADFDLTATSGSALAITYATSDESVATISGRTVNIVGAGTTTITSLQAGNDYFTAAAAIMQELEIGKAELSTVADDISRAYGVDNPIFTINYDGFAGDDSMEELDEVPEVGTIATVTSEVGTYAIAVSGGSDSNYSYAYAAGTLTIEKANQEVSFTSISDFDLVDQTTLELVASASSGLEISFELIEGDASIEGSLLTVNSQGTIVIKALQVGDANHQETAATQSFSVSDSNKEAQQITFTSIDNQVYGSIVTLSATASSTLPVTIELLSGLGSITNNGELQILGAGSYAIRATQAGDEVFHPADPIDHVFNVLKADLTFDVEDVTIAQGVALPEFEYTISGFRLDDKKEELDELPVILTDVQSSSLAGQFDLLLSGGTDARYNYLFANGLLTIESVLSIKTEIGGVELYPNPADEEITIFSDLKNAELRVLDLQGRILITMPYDGEKISLDVSPLQSGIYLLQLVNGEAQRFKKLVVKH